MATKNTRRPIRIKVPGFAAFMALGLFALAWRIIELLAHDPRLASNQLFSMLAQGIVLSGLITGAGGVAFGIGQLVKKEDPGGS